MARDFTRRAEPRRDFFCTIHGAPIRIACDQAETDAMIREYLRAYADDGESATGGLGFTVEISRKAAAYPVPLHARRVLSYESVRGYFYSGVLYFTDYFSTLEVNPAARVIRGNLGPDSIKDFGKHSFVPLLFTLALFEMLRSHGLYYLHASALEDPGGTGCLISGNAGSGKTSLTLALIESGFKFLCDDTVFLRLEGEDDVSVLGFARDFHVPQDLFEERDLGGRFGELPDYCSRRDRKLLPADRFFPGQRLAGFQNPGLLLFPRISEQGSAVHALSAAKALTELLPQSLAVMFNPETARPHLEALKRTIANARAFRLLTGPELKGDPDKCRELYERAREMASGQGGET